MDSPHSVSVQSEPATAVNVQLVDKLPAWARAFGVLAFVGAIIAFIVPAVGPLFITIPAALACMAALYGGDKKLGSIVFGILAVNLVVSPSVWLSFFGSAMSQQGSSGVIWIPVLDALLVLGIIPFLFRKKLA